MLDILEKHSKEYIIHYKNLKQIMYDSQAMHTTLSELDNHWIWGKSGVGKSRSVREKYGDNLYYKMANKWWDGYQEEETVLIDDFDKNHDVLGHHIKIWADRYPFRAEIKNHAVMLRPRRIVVTSNYHPKDIWSNDKALLEAISRRFKITEMIELPDHDPLPMDINPHITLISKKSKKVKKHDVPYMKEAKRFKYDHESGKVVPNTTIQAKIDAPSLTRSDAFVGELIDTPYQTKEEAMESLGYVSEEM